MKKFNNDNLELFFESGLCCLEDYLKNFYSNNNNQFDKKILKSNLKYIFKFGITLVFNLYDYLMFHSDLKPPNILIVKNDLNKK